jgi:hypothetical protein
MTDTDPYLVYGVKDFAKGDRNSVTYHVDEAIGLLKWTLDITQYRDRLQREAWLEDAKKSVDRALRLSSKYIKFSSQSAFLKNCKVEVNLLQGIKGEIWFKFFLICYQLKQAFRRFLGSLYLLLMMRSFRDS